MNKKVLSVLFLSSLCLTGCGEETPNKPGKEDPAPSWNCSHSSFSFKNHKGLIDLEQCDNCGAKAYKFPIQYAEGFKNPDGLMNTTGPNSKSTWRIEGQLASGNYSVQITAKLDKAASKSKTWEGESDAEGADAYRYWVSIDDNENYPTSDSTWEDEGFETSTLNSTEFIKKVSASAATKNVSLVHGNLGDAGLYIDNIRLIADTRTELPDTLPACPIGVFDPLGNTGGDTGGGSYVDVDGVKDIGTTPGGEGVGTYGNVVDRKVTISSASQKVITLTSNNTGAEVSTLDDKVQEYVDAMYAAEENENLSETKKYQMRDNACGNVNPENYQGKYYENGVPTQNKGGKIDHFGESDQDNFKNVVLTFATDKADATTFNVEVGTKADLSDAKVIEVYNKKVELSNLFVGTTYYWRVSDVNGKYHSDIGSFKTKGSFRTINAGAAYNVRDIGGKMTSSGKRMKQGLIYRGGELTPVQYDTGITQKHIITLDQTGKKIFHDELKVRVELDFRNAGGESNNQNKSYIGDDVTFQRESCSSLANFYNGDATMLKRIFTTFANATPEAAVYCHCWGGADRTGTAFFLLEGLLGVSYTECLMDYEFTSFDSIHTRKRNGTVTDYNNYNYNFSGLPNAIKSSSYYGSTKSFSEIVEAWMKGKLKMTDAEITKLKTNLLED